MLCHGLRQGLHGEVRLVLALLIVALVIVSVIFLAALYVTIADKDSEGLVFLVPTAYVIVVLAICMGKL